MRTPSLSRMNKRNGEFSTFSSRPSRWSFPTFALSGGVRPRRQRLAETGGECPRGPHRTRGHGDRVQFQGAAGPSWLDSARLVAPTRLLASCDFFRFKRVAFACPNRTGLLTQRRLLNGERETSGPISRACESNPMWLALRPRKARSLRQTRPTDHEARQGALSSADANTFRPATLRPTLASRNGSEYDQMSSRLRDRRPQLLVPAPGPAAWTLMNPKRKLAESTSATSGYVRLILFSALIALVAAALVYTKFFL